MTEVQQAGQIRRRIMGGEKGGDGFDFENDGVFDHDVGAKAQWDRYVSAPPTTGALSGRVEAPEAGQRKRAAAARNAERHIGCNWGPRETRHPIARPPPG